MKLLYLIIHFNYYLIKKMNIKPLLPLICCLTIICSLFGCNLIKTKNNILEISAGISLIDVMPEIESDYLKQKQNVTLSYNFAGAGTLAKQIEEGGAADIFISAGSKEMDNLQDKNLITENTRTNILRNKIALIATKDSSAIFEIKDLVSNKVNKIALSDPEKAPDGRYSRESLIHFGILERIKNKVILGKDPREVIKLVANKKADAGLAYVTDAIQSEKVRVVSVVPENSHSPIVYCVAVLQASKNVALAKDFVKFLTSDRAKAIFVNYGFTIFSVE